MANRNEFTYSKSFRVDRGVRKAFEDEGFILLRSLWNGAEVEKLLRFFETSPAIERNSYRRGDGQELMTRVCLWNKAGDDIGDMVSRSRRVVDTMQELLGGQEIYHYHSKLMMKSAEIGGRHVWHQDYGYWYENGCLTPDMGSVFIALDPCTKENGCLRVLSGSHKMGRLDHVSIGNRNEQGDAPQRGADPERVKWAERQYECVHCELQPGDAIFFHSNLLHTSDQNRSKTRRWSMIIAYNRADNNPLFEHHHPRYHRLQIVEDEELMRCDTKESTTEKWYFRPDIEKKN